MAQSTFFNTLELGVGYAAVASATALSQVRRADRALARQLCPALSAAGRRARGGPAWPRRGSGGARRAQVIGAPLAAGLLFMDGVAGRRGWTWLFLIEGLITIVFGMAVLLFLPRKPATLRVLQPDERAWLQGRHEHADKHARAQTKSSGSFWAGLVSWRLWYLGICWFLVRPPRARPGPLHIAFFLDMGG